MIGLGRRWIRGAVWLALALLVGSCGHQEHVQGPGAEGEFLKGREAYERGDQLRAIEILEAFERNHPGSQFIDDALFFLGKAHQASGEQILARQSFQRLLDGFPRSNHAEDALFELAQCWVLSMYSPALDPEPAEEALRACEVYVRRYPEGVHREAAEQAILKARTSLAKKDYLNGRTYLRLGRPEAARRYFQMSLDRWVDAPISAKAMVGIATSYEKQGQWADARQAYTVLLEHLGDDPDRFENGRQIAAAARRRLERLPQ
jgi:outer membrane assembly lipoprotein YfiO